jgi:hypothetical protein
MKQPSLIFSGAGVVALSAALALAGCGGGGGTTPATGNGNSTAGLGGTIGSISSTLSAVSTVPVKLEGAAAPAPVDVSDLSPYQSSGVTSTDVALAAGASSIKTHALHANTGATASASGKHAQSVAQNSPWDLSYFGGFVLGGAQSDNIFVNCTLSCRQAGNVFPGKFLNDLYSDPFLSLLEQYLSSPGELVVPGGKFEKGPSVDVPFKYDVTPPPGFTNPVVTQEQIFDILVAGVNALPPGNTGLVHIYNILLPPNVDTCFSGNTICWSPDNPATFAFCAYHGAVSINSNVYLFTVIPWVSLNYCSASSSILNFPNQVAPGNDPADAIYGVLSHETFETITDPIPGGGWYNYSTGDEIGDECPGYQNFVTLNKHHYYIQSEYSDVGQECISANLTNGTQQTP